LQKNLVFPGLPQSQILFGRGPFFAYKLRVLRVIENGNLFETLSIDFALIEQKRSKTEMNVSINFTIPDPAQLLVYLIIGIIVALLAGAVARMRSGLGYFMTVLFAVVGAWLFANILQIAVLGDVAIAGVPLIQAFIGALIFGLLGVAAFGRSRRDVVVYDE
jgi:uncharacterized membrane protein YeaQ/YmgE (transglycosylase-associated protein family)